MGQCGNKGRTDGAIADEMGNARRLLACLDLIRSSHAPRAGDLFEVDEPTRTRYEGVRRKIKGIPLSYRA